MSHRPILLVAAAPLLFSLGCHAGGEAETAPVSPSCPPSWLQSPSVDPVIATPSGNGTVIAHTAATGSQNYLCANTQADGGSTYAWKFMGPEATLNDCRGVPAGRHFASEGGAAAPQWQTNDGAYVVGHKVAASTPDGGAPAVPWLLLSTERTGGTGPLHDVTYVQRVGTTGGVAPGVACNAGNAGITQKVPYTADYYFYGRSQ